VGLELIKAVSTPKVKQRIETIRQLTDCSGKKQKEQLPLKLVISVFIPRSYKALSPTLFRSGFQNFFAMTHS
jgi:hypothetical protein